MGFEGGRHCGALRYRAEGEPLLVSPKAAIHTLDAQAFHTIPDGIASFERLPPR